jgi:hypothetical protein
MKRLRVKLQPARDTTKAKNWSSVSIETERNVSQTNMNGVGSPPTFSMIATMAFAILPANKLAATYRISSGVDAVQFHCSH